MSSQSIPASGAQLTNKALLSSKHSIHGESQNRRQSKDNDLSSFDEADQIGDDKSSVDSAKEANERKAMADKADQEQRGPSFKTLFDLISPEAGNTQGAIGGESETNPAPLPSSSDRVGAAVGPSSYQSVQQLLEQVGLGSMQDTAPIGGQLTGAHLSTQATGAEQEQQAKFLVETTGADSKSIDAQSPALKAMLQAGKEGLESLSNGQHNGQSSSFLMDGKTEKLAALQQTAESAAAKAERMSVGSLDQLAKITQSGQSAAIDMTNLKSYSLDTRSASAVDTLVPIVKDAMLTPTQKAQRDGFTVLRQETHFSPVNMLETMGAAASQTGLSNVGSVLQQISSALSDSLDGQGSATPGNSNDAMANGGLRLHKSGDVLRVLDIQLHPADLGKVRLSVRLNDNNIEVRIEATRAETAKMLESNQAELNKLLQKAGYHADKIAVVAVDDKGPSQILPPSSSDSLNQQNGQDRSGFSGSNNGAGASDGQQQQSGSQDEASAFSLDAFEDQAEGSHHESSPEQHPHRGLTL